MEAASVIPSIKVQVPDEGYHQALIACQVACPVHTDARGYVRAIAAGNYEEGQTPLPRSAAASAAHRAKRLAGAAAYRGSTPTAALSDPTNPSRFVP
jgi:hypothetical protein